MITRNSIHYFCIEFWGVQESARETGRAGSMGLWVKGPHPEEIGEGGIREGES